MENKVECSSEDLIEENRSLRCEIDILKGHLSMLLTEEDKGETKCNLIRLQLQSQSHDKFSELQSEISGLKFDNEALEKFNKDQGLLGKQLNLDKVNLEERISAMQRDLLRIMPLQCEKEKYRKLSDEAGIALRLASEENRVLVTNLDRTQRLADDKQIQLDELLAAQLRMEHEIVQLKDATASISASLESEKSERSKFSSRVVDLSNELASQGKRNASQAKEIERQLSVIENGKQELLILKSRLALRDEAIREHENAVAAAKVPAPSLPHSHVTANLRLSPRSRFRKAAFQRQYELHEQHTDHYDLGVGPQCTGMDQVVSDLPTCIPNLPTFNFLSNNARRYPRKSDS